jgi:hypothetical protein
VQGSLNHEVKSSLKTWFGNQLKGKIEIRPPTEPPVLNTGPEYFSFELVRWDDLDVRCNLWINPKNQILLADSIRIMFYHLFYSWMDDKMRYDIIINGRLVRRGQIKNCILEFCEYYNIPFNHINFDMLSKRYYRYRKRQEELKEIKKNKINILRKCPQIVL